jgi:hypothetical protein
MAMTQSKVGPMNQYEGSLHRYVETGSANTQLVSTVGPIGQPFRVVSVIVSYSAAPTQTGTLVKLVSGAGAAYGATLSTGTANAQFTLFQGTNDLIFGSDDSITVTAPAAGGVITASVAVYIEKM